jgi:type I restriction enzyme, S subunit
MTNTLTGHDLEEGELPSGWAVSRLGDLAGLGPRVPAELLEADTNLSFIPMAAVTEVSGEVDLTQTITAQEGKKRSLKYFADGDVIFAKITPCMENGKVARPSGLTNGAAFGSTEFHVFRPTPAVDGDFLRLFLVHDDFRYEAARAMTGAVGQRRVPKKYLEDFLLPTPPLEEQARIVEILEDQLSRLDTALQSVNTVREKAAQFRRSLLHAAFTGALTGHEVEEGELPDGWEPSTLGQIAKWGSGGTPRSGVASYYGGNIPWAVIGDLTEAIVLTTEKSITEAGLAASSAKLIEPGTVMIAMYGASIGRTGVTGREMATNQAIAFARINDKIVGRDFLLKYLQFQKSAFVKAGKGGAQPNISQTIIKTWPIVLPSLDEQERIVEILEDQLSRLDASMAVADAVEERSTALRRSLLHSAFTGRLTEEWREAVNV